MSGTIVKSSTHKWEKNPLGPYDQMADDPTPSSQTSSNHMRSDYNMSMENEGPAEPDSLPFTFASLLNTTNNFRTECKLVSLQQEFDRTLFVAGREGAFQGRVLTTVERTGKVKFGRIYVEIVGFEEIVPASSRKKPIRRLFFHAKQDLQAPELPPSDAVIAGKADEDNCWLARKGRTAFEVKIAMAHTNAPGASASEKGGPLPSSFWSRKFGGIRYIVTTCAEVKVNNNSPILLVTQREMTVIEGSPLTGIPAFPYSIPVHSPLHVQETKTVRSWLFGKGNVSIQAEVHIAEAGMNDAVSGKGWVAGGLGFVGVEVSNDSPKPIKKLYISLIRRLKTFSVTGDGQLSPVSFSRATVYKKVYESGSSRNQQIRNPAKGYAEDDKRTRVPGFAVAKNFVWDGVDSGDSRKFVVDIEVPLSIRTVRFGMLLDVSFVVQVAVQLPHGDRMSVEIPVTILHPSALYPSLPPLKLNIVAPKALAHEVCQLLPPARATSIVTIHTITPHPLTSTTISRASEMEKATKESGYTLLGDDDDDGAVASTDKPANTLERDFGTARSISITGKAEAYHRKSRQQPSLQKVVSVPLTATAPAAEGESTPGNEEYRKRVQEMLVLGGSEGMSDVAGTIDKMFRATVDEN
ncbi:hypothetical protein SeLEV6574_g03905 [Synchytrium endobioticum]|nr:hypothetical protein SeLEV6574_g03905 [Synchytrium endobioticum]